MLGLSDGIDNLNGVKTDLALCLLVAWVIVYLCIMKGIKSSGKVERNLQHLVMTSFERVLDSGHVRDGDESLSPPVRAALARLHSSWRLGRNQVLHFPRSFAIVGSAGQSSCDSYSSETFLFNIASRTVDLARVIQAK